MEVMGKAAWSDGRPTPEMNMLSLVFCSWRVCCSLFEMMDMPDPPSTSALALATHPVGPLTISSVVVIKVLVDSDGFTEEVTWTVPWDG